MNSAIIKTWLIRGEFEKLENVVLEGRGTRLLGEHSPDLRTRVFLKSLPNYLTKIHQVHNAVTQGRLLDVQKLITSDPKKKYAIAKDTSGTPLLHKAVYNDHEDIVEWIIENYPLTARQKDIEGRTALHYCGVCTDPEAIWNILIEGGCDRNICDKRGRPADYYLEHPSEIQLLDFETMEERKSTNGRRELLELKPSSIRIWIHNRDIAKLQHLLWEGHGSRLKLETSNNPRVRRFLEAVPFIMVTIKQIHNAVIKNDIDDLVKKIDHPVAPIILCAKDNNGLNPLHKAAGLGHLDIATEIVDRLPQAAIAQDIDGRTPLHYAAALRDNGVMYDLLVEHGADESKLDNKHKAAAFYKNRPGDIDLSNLVVVPDAPRVCGSVYPKNWDWRILENDGGIILKPLKKHQSAADADSAFGSVESALKSASGGDDGFEIREADNGIDVIMEPVEFVTNDVEDEKAAEDGQSEAPMVDEEQAQTPETDVEATDNKLETNGMTHENVPQLQQEYYENEPNGTEIGDDKKIQDGETHEPSIADSGVDETRIDEDQVIVGEHEELPESELHDGIMPDDPDIDNLLVNGNMEQLAALVLNGEGKRLVARQSGNPELQAFIDNVPSYIGKIHAVHIAAKEGNLRDLQSALDRRKFAIARDNASPHGATPLHVAVIFGHTSIIRYLAGRFPETTHAIDIDGRTPLHYAATLADNGHYYNLLLNLGGNPLIQDNFGQKADYYKENHNDLSHKQLLRDFGAREELADEILTDKDDANIDIAIFREEEGRYLASSLGNPLIKGLTEVAHTRPKDPVTHLAKFLYNFANKINSGNSSTSPNYDVLIIPEREQKTCDFENENADDNDDDAGYPPSTVSDVPESAFNNTNRDEHGQSLLHFTAVRSHPKDSLFHIMQERQINIGYRDELYRTARDVADESNFTDNVEEIDRYVIYLAARGETEKLVELLLEGYDPILGIEDDGVNIIDIAAERNREATAQFLQSIPNYTSQRDEIHRAIRAGDLDKTQDIFAKNGSGGTLLAVGKNTLSRCALHIAVLSEHTHIVEFIAKTYPETLRIGDNLERTALHYAMGVPSVETISAILIKAGAKRVHKDLKSRQPSYYFMNKTDIQRIQEEEQTMAK